MPRYIKANKEYLEPFFYEHLTDNGMIAAQNAIDEVPTADVQEVIYCKNCKNYCKFENGAVVCEEFGGYIKDTDFCSRGTRKER